MMTQAFSKSYFQRFLYMCLFSFMVGMLAAGFSACGDNGGGGNGDATLDGGYVDGDVDATPHGDASIDADTGHPEAGTEPDAANLCGNGITDEGEVCDDGNNISGDGCNSTCTQVDDEDILATTNYISDQLSPSTCGIGDFAVAVWTDFHSLDQDGSAVVYKLFGSDGAPRENNSGYSFENLVNSTYAGNQTEPDVGLAANGSFVVVWTDASDSANSGKNIKARLFEGDGTPKVNGVTNTDEEFLVSGSVPGDQYEPKVAVSELGNFMVVWTDSGGNGDDGAGTSIMGRVFSETGLPAINSDTGDSEPFTINSNHPGNQYEPAIAGGVSGAGHYVVLWTDASGWHDSSSTGISGTILNQNGANMAGGDLAINSTKNGAQSHPAVGSQGPSGFVAVWTDASGVDDISFTGIRSRLFDGSGIPRTNSIGDDENDFLVNTLTNGRQQLPEIAVYPNTISFAVVWQDGSGTDGSFSGIRSRLFYATAAPHPNPLNQSTDDFQVNTTTNNAQLAPVVSVPGPIALFFWEDESHTPPDTESFAIRFRVLSHLF